MEEDRWYAEVIYERRVPREDLRKLESDSTEHCRLSGFVHVDSGVEVHSVRQLERVQQSALEFEREQSAGDKLNVIRLPLFHRVFLSRLMHCSLLKN